jgi:uncharacterized membrane-anchored protein YjiN (DUF445 family)
MKKIFVIAGFLVAFAVSAAAQVTPAGAGDKDLRDTNIKGRSNELDRVEREAKKEAKKNRGKSNENQAAEAAEDKLAAKYPEIKEDFEKIQTAQAFIIEAYTKSEKINYEQIARSSSEINKSALRLDSNLFPPVENAEEKKDEKDDKKNNLAAKSLRDLIVDLDNAIGNVVTSPMFQNLRAVDAKVSEKTKNDLQAVINLSDALKKEAEKLNAGQK